MLDKDRFSEAEITDLNERAERDKKLRSKQNKKKYFLMFISLIIASAIWLYVVNDKNPTIKKVFYDVDVEFLNKGALSSHGMVITEIDHEKVKVVLEGKRSKIRSLDKSDIVAYIDVSEYTAGENYVNVNVNVPYSTELVSVNPSQIKLQIEKISSDKRDIKVSFTSGATDGYEPHYSELSSKTATISGASSATAKVAYLSAKVDTASLTADPQIWTIELQPVDDSGERVEDVKVIENKVNVTAQLYKVKKVPLITLTSGEPADGYVLEAFEAPSKVSIAGPVGEIDEIKSVTAKTIDITNFTASKEVDIEITLPGNIILARDQIALEGKVKISKEQSTVKKFTYASDNISLKSEPLGMKASITGSVELNVMGTSAQLQSIGAEDFMLTADCSSLPEGKSTVKLDVIMSEKAKSVGVKTDTPYVEIDLSEEESA